MEERNTVVPYATFGEGWGPRGPWLLGFYESSFYARTIKYLKPITKGFSKLAKSAEVIVSLRQLLSVSFVGLLSEFALAGYNADPKDKSTMSFRDNFTAFWNIWKFNILKRDYALLDEIHPNRIRTVDSGYSAKIKKDERLD